MNFVSLLNLNKYFNYDEGLWKVGKVNSVGTAAQEPSKDRKKGFRKTVQ